MIEVLVTFGTSRHVARHASKQIRASVRPLALTSAEQRGPQPQAVNNEEEEEEEEKKGAMWVAFSDGGGGGGNTSCLLPGK